MEEPLGYVPSFDFLTHGWFLIKFWSDTDAQDILAKKWTWGPFGLILTH